MFDAFTGAGAGDSGSLELLSDVSGTESGFQAVLAEQVDVTDVAGEQGGSVEGGVEDVGADPDAR
jgi:hypothetical protein